MPVYVLLTRLSSPAQREIIKTPTRLSSISDILEQWDAKILADYHMMGEWHHCTVFEVSDNFRAHQALLQQELTSSPDTWLLPGIDLPLFERMLRQELRTEGPHQWQVKWWAKLARLCFRWYQYDRWVWRYFKPFQVTGTEHFTAIKAPCIVIANHTSHFDSLALHACLPLWLRWNIYFGAAADRWFLRAGGGRRDMTLQPWYNSLITGCFPIRRGGGSATLDYSRWLLDQGANLAIFPEGTRSTSHKMARFKHGVALLALQKKLPILPVYLTGLARIRPKGSRKVTPGPVHAHIQPPLYLPEGMAVPDATRLIYEELNAVHKSVIAHGDAAGRWDLPHDSHRRPIKAAPAQ